MQTRPCIFLVSAAQAALCFIVANSAIGAVNYKVTLLPIPPGFESTDGRDGHGGLQVGRGAGAATNGGFHALLWQEGNSSVVNLHPEGYTYSFAGSVYGNQQVGWVGTGNSANKATLWRGTSDSAVLLHPEGYTASNAYGLSETHQVGWGLKQTPYGDHALIWSGTAESAVDIHPDRYIQSRAYEVAGPYQVGYAIDGYGALHAALWQGTAESFVDLNPQGFKDSFARSTDGIFQVGSGTPLGSNEQHALLWQGTPESVLDLHPPALRYSHIQDVSGNVQVGFGRATSNSNSDRALLWTGSSDSVVDLHQFVSRLGPTFVGSRAFDIEPNGEVIGHVFDSVGTTYAVRWTVVPEPTSLVMTTILALLVGVGLRLRPAADTQHSSSIVYPNEK